MSWIKLHRGVFEEGLFKNEPFSEREAWIWLISEAKFEPTPVRADNRVLMLERGDLYCSVRYLAKAWSWDKSRVHRFLKFLEGQKMIERKSETQGRQFESVVTICNYNKYQSNESGQDIDSETQVRQSQDTSETNIKNQKKIRASKKESFDSSVAVEKINEVLAKYKLSEISGLSDKRLKSLTARIKDSGGTLESFLLLIDSGLSESSFLRGETSDWKADFDFFLQESKFLKVKEGAYKGASSSKGKVKGVFNDYSGTYKGGVPL